MKHTQILIAVGASLLLLGGCASSKTPPPMPLQIPVQLLNYEPEDVVAPARPDATAVKAIKATDNPEAALDVLLEYLPRATEYVVVIEGQNAVLQEQKVMFQGNQTKIKQIIMMTQQNR